MTDAEIVPGLARLQAFRNSLTDYLDGRQILPRECWYLDIVLLALLSKSLTVADAILCLLKNEFHDEAFGMIRTMEDLFTPSAISRNRFGNARAKVCPVLR